MARNERDTILQHLRQVVILFCKSSCFWDNM